MNEALTRQGFTVKNNTVYACNGIGLKNLLTAGYKWLKIHVNVVNSLNVFPVPDGDTGTNMLLTLRSALTEAEQAPNYNVDTMAAHVAHGALMGARGNSGIIFSQFLHGMAETLQGKRAFTTDDFAQAVQLGANKAYASVVNPVEGTILTVAQAVATAAVRNARQTGDLSEQLSQVVVAARAAQARSPDLLPILKEAGVTDSGGQGLLYIVEGWLRFLQNQPLDGDPNGNPASVQLPDWNVDHADFGYDVQFIIHGQQLNVATIRKKIDAMGRSTVVVGNANTVKVHVHAEDPGVPLSFGSQLGTLSDVVVENLTQQARNFEQTRATWSRTEPLQTAIVAVVPGNGLAEIFTGLGVARVISGGQRMNPSVQELLQTIDQIQAEHVLILPNNSNITLTAQHVEKMSAGKVHVVPTHSVPQGIAALLAFNAHADIEKNLALMLTAAQQVTTVEVTQAVRDSTVNGMTVKAGDMIALQENRLVATGVTPEDAAVKALSGLNTNGYELATIYFGNTTAPGQADVLADRMKTAYAHVEVEVHNGGQPHYPYIISLE